MKLDLLYEIDVPKPWPGEHPSGQREAEQHAYREAIEQIKLADSLGFQTTWHVEHHFREGRSHCPSSEVLLGALSQVTENIRLGFGVTLMPHAFIHPARVAEKVATVDVLSGGRVEWGTGRSTPMEQTAFHVDRPRSRDQWEAAVKTVVGMWGSEYYEEHSEFLDFPRRMVTPKPFQDPHPACWMAATSPDTVELAGRKGLGLLSLSIQRTLDEVAETVRRYRAAAAKPEPITHRTTNKVAAYTLVHCAESFAQAEDNGIWEALWWWYHNLAEFTLEWEFPHFDQADRERMFPLLKARAEGQLDLKPFHEQDMFIVGDPEMCFNKLKRYAEAGCDSVICYVQFGHLSHESVMKTIELLGREVIPELDKL